MSNNFAEGLHTKGMKALLDKLEKMSDLSEEQMDEALKEGAKVVKKTEVDLVKKLHNEYSEDVGWKEIQTYKIKKRRNGARIIQTGIRAKVSKGKAPSKNSGKAPKSGYSKPRNTHWNRVRGLWFNNYGFYHNRTGKYVAGSNWIGKAYENSKEEAYKRIRKKVLKELDL